MDQQAAFLVQRQSQILFAGLFLLYNIIFLGIGMVSAIFRYTVFFSTPFGSLVSDMFDRRFYFTWTLALYFYVPWGMLWTSAYPFKKKVRTAHTVLLALLLVHQLIGQGFSTYDYATRNNVGVANGALNEFNSPWYCCEPTVVATPNNGCGLFSGVCVPGVTAANLSTNIWAEWKYWTALFAWVFTFIHIFVFNFAFVPVALSYRDAAEDPLTKPLQPVERRYSGIPIRRNA